MRLHILSDLHLEYADFKPEVGEADVIVLAGDIHLGSQGMAWARQCWPSQEIIYVPGNHEYYDSEIQQVNREMTEAAQRLGVHYLNRSEIRIQNVRFLGVTLWTDFALHGDEEIPWAIQAARKGVPDYRRIALGNEAFQPQDAIVMSRRDAQWLDERLTETDSESATVVVTHHPPSIRSLAAHHRNNLQAAAYASNYDYLLGRSDLWIHGHTHESVDCFHGKTRVLCNPRGYLRRENSPENENFVSDLVITLEIPA